jgi:beta-lactamase class A
MTALAAILAIGATAAVLTSQFRGPKPPAVVSGQQAAQSVPEIPASAVTVGNWEGSTGSPNSLRPLGDTIGKYLDDNAPGSSVYLEDLTSKLTVHIGDSRQFNTKSLMKVPLVMSLYKAAEKGKLDADIPVTVQEDHIDRDFGDLWQKGAGHQLTLRQAAGLALQKSDNTAIRLINNHVFDVLPFELRAHEVIRLELRVDENRDAYASSQAYSDVFRCLHSACYNSRQHSDEILGLLKDTDFRAPSLLLPADTPVAHKIGNAQGSGYNDCGIIYGPKTPIIFCIMLTKNQPTADRDISRIVKQAYDFFEK